MSGTWRTAGVGVFLAAFLLSSCSGKEHDNPLSPVRVLHDLCFSGCDCATRTARVRLDLDTHNLPSINGGQQALLLTGRASARTDWRDIIWLTYEGTLPAEVDPGAAGQSGWKVEIRGAGIEYCRTCYTNSGLADIITLRAPLDSVQFLFDPADTLGVFIEVSDVELSDHAAR